MSNDWIAYVSNRMPEVFQKFNAESVKISTVQSNYSSVLRTTRFTYDYKGYKMAWQSWITEHKVLSKLDGRELFKLGYQQIILGDGLDATILYKTLYEGVIDENTFWLYHLNCRSNMLADPTKPSVGGFRLKNVISRISQSSIFKDYNMTARAYGIDKPSALIKMMQITPNIGAESEEVAKIQAMVANERSDILEYLCSDSYGCWENLTGYLHPTIINDSVQEAKNMVASNENEKKDTGDRNYIDVGNKLALGMLVMWTQFTEFSIDILY